MPKPQNRHDAWCVWARAALDHGIPSAWYYANFDKVCGRLFASYKELTPAQQQFTDQLLGPNGYALARIYLARHFHRSAR
jgi:hypothetical protein